MIRLNNKFTFGSQSDYIDMTFRKMILKKYLHPYIVLSFIPSEQSLENDLLFCTCVRLGKCSTSEIENPPFSVKFV